MTNTSRRLTPSDNGLSRTVRVLAFPVAVAIVGLAYIAWKLPAHWSTTNGSAHFYASEAIFLLIAAAAFVVWFLYRRPRPAGVYLGVVFIQCMLTWWCMLAATQ